MAVAHDSTRHDTDAGAGFDLPQVRRFFESSARQRARLAIVFSGAVSPVDPLNYHGRPRDALVHRPVARVQAPDGPL
ncbi:MAG: hypothetical protein QOE48_6153 [Mycobacterium sp.]|jgi:hypothetical protein|nr:hypothetical protein [Mycobacterium sp.]MDT5310439.1 hypothetical protein [Mycobacterium sp.]